MAIFCTFLLQASEINSKNMNFKNINIFFFFDVAYILFCSANLRPYEQQVTGELGLKKHVPHSCHLKVDISQ